MAAEPVFENGRLIYAGRDCYLIPEELLQHRGGVKALDLSFNSIRDLEGLEEFSSTLEELVLDNNELLESANFPVLPKVELLSLCNNKIEDLYGFIDNVEHKFPSLTYLSLLGNRACPDSLSQMECDDTDYSRYRGSCPILSCLSTTAGDLLSSFCRRPVDSADVFILIPPADMTMPLKYVIYKFPKLKFLDSKPVKREERKLANKQGPYLRVIRPSTDETTDDENSMQYRPLPTEPDPKSAGSGMYKKAKYVYHGRHSEGNRFIRNDDL